MNGKITFNNVEEVGKFLKAFTGSTATFEIVENPMGGYILTFTGGF